MCVCMSVCAYETSKFKIQIPTLILILGTRANSQPFLRKFAFGV